MDASGAWAARAQLHRPPPRPRLDARRRATTRSGERRIVAVRQANAILDSKTHKENTMAQQDACTLLDDDHNEVIRMFEQYKAAHDARRQQLLAAQISRSLLV